VRVLVTGVTGQDGYYLAELHAKRGDEVFALVRGQRPVVLPEGVTEIRGDLLDQMSLVNAVKTAQPDTVYNLAAVASIAASWGSPDLVANVTGLGVLRLLEAVRTVAPGASFVHASTSDMFGNWAGVSTENTPFDPKTPYGCAKLYAHQMCRTYRDAYGMRISTAIFYPHTSPRQGSGFIIPKVTRAAVAISRGFQTELRLGNIDVVRDWGWSYDYVRAFPILASRDAAVGDYILATGVKANLAKLCQLAFDSVGLDWVDHVKVDDSFYRPTDVKSQQGCPSKAWTELGWRARVGLPETVRRMVEHAKTELGWPT
jgi:GDPmannose 4,6-dehydratase